LRIRQNSKILSVFLAFTLLLTALQTPVNAQERRISFIRDAETEHTLSLYAQPLFIAAGLDPAAVRLYIVNNDDINAFVAGGQNVFMHTGLLMRAETPEQVKGVLAHELGHVSGGHLARAQEELSRLSAATIATMVVGGAAAVASGSSQALGAVLTGSSQLGQRLALRYSRTQESAADQAGVRYLAAAELPPTGLYEFMQILDSTSLLRRGADPYVQSHPLTQDRIAFLKNKNDESPFIGRQVSKELQIAHERMRGKLLGFLGNPQQIAAGIVPPKFKYSPLTLQYAKAIATYRLGDSTAGEAAFAKLFEQFPGDAYLHETRGQLRLELANIDGAIEDYARAYALAPTEPALRMAYAQALLADEKNNKVNARLIEEVVRPVVISEPDNIGAWRMLALSYAFQGKDGQAALATAERAFLQRDRQLLESSLKQAEKLLADDKTAMVRVSDLREALKNALAQDERFR